MDNLGLKRFARPTANNHHLWTHMDKQSEKLSQLVQTIERRIIHRIDRLTPVRNGLLRQKLEVEDIGYLSSGERAVVLLAARREHEPESPLFIFLRLDDDLQAFVLLSRERPELVGSRIAANI